MNITERLISHFKSKTLTAEAFGIGREALRLWRTNGIPLSRALDVENVMLGEITAEEVIHEARAGQRKMRKQNVMEGSSP